MMMTQDSAMAGHMPMEGCNLQSPFQMVKDCPSAIWVKMICQAPTLTTHSNPMSWDQIFAGSNVILWSRGAILTKNDMGCSHGRAHEVLPPPVTKPQES